ncbi:MAG: hypothetical protein KAI86_00135 [Desulfobacterales bacterium]|jgi:hypothetical protein|nr:hypothetical protein [Desulfobacterales bacterium]
MTKMLLYSVMVLFLGSVTIIACSDNKETESEKGTIEKMTDKAAKEMVNKIRTPIDKARSVKNQQEDRLNEIDKIVKDQ